MPYPPAALQRSCIVAALQRCRDAASWSAYRWAVHIISAAARALKALSGVPPRSTPAARVAAMAAPARKRPAAADSAQPPPRASRRASGASTARDERALLHADTLPMNGAEAAAAAAAFHEDASAGRPAAAAAPVWPAPIVPPSRGWRRPPISISQPLSIPLPRVPTIVRPPAVQVPSLVKDRTCAIYTKPIPISEYVLEEWVIRMAAHYPPPSKRYDVLAVTGNLLICLDPFGCFPDEIDKLPPCPPW